MRTLALAFAILAPATMLAQNTQAPARDQSRIVFSGTAQVSGTVVLDDDKRPPLRRATVTLSREGNEDIRVTSTDDAGRYLFSNLPPGRYSLSANKAGHIAMSYGAPKPAMPGRSVVLTDGQVFAATPIALLRGAAIAGRLLDRAGRPAPSVLVRAVPFVTVGSERKLRIVSGGTPSANTNEHGDYRIFGLLPGDYLVFASVSSNDTVRELTAEDITRAKTPDAAWQPPRPRSNAPTMFPGVSDPAAATPISVVSGEERLDVTFSLQSVLVARISGVVVGQDGRPVANAAVERLPRTQAALMPTSVYSQRGASNGSFAFEGVQPGEYQLLVRVLDAAAPQGVGPAPQVSGSGQWGLLDLSVNGSDQSELTVRLQPGLSVDGRISIPAAASSIDLTRTRVQIVPLRDSSLARTLQTNAGADGTFRIDGVWPGSYRLLIVGLPAPFATRSATLNGRDVMDVPIEIAPNTHVTGLDVTLSGSLAEISGSLTDSANRPATDVYVVVFAQDRQYWQPSSRRVASVRPTEDGKYLITGLPPGDYLLAAVTELDLTIRNEPSFLDELAKAAIKLTLTDGEKKIQDLRVGGR